MNYYTYRTQRLNYYAVKALKARVYLWADNKAEAYREAKAVTAENIEECRTMTYTWIHMREEKWNEEMNQEIVKAHTQAEMMEVLLPILTEEEAAVYKRGRNAKSFTMAKNATMSDYRKATGFEALMGYLYLKDEFERLVELVKTGVEEIRLKL